MFGNCTGHYIDARYVWAKQAVKKCFKKFESAEAWQLHLQKVHKNEQVQKNSKANFSRDHSDHSRSNRKRKCEELNDETPSKTNRLVVLSQQTFQPPPQFENLLTEISKQNAFSDDRKKKLIDRFTMLITGSDKVYTKSEEFNSRVASVIESIRNMGSNTIEVGTEIQQLCNILLHHKISRTSKQM